MNRRLIGLLLLAAAVMACRSAGREQRQQRPSAAPADTLPRDPSAPAPNGGSPAGTPGVGARPPVVSSGDPCHVTRGPVQLPVTGPVTLWMDEGAPGGEPQILFNQDGIARRVDLPAPPPARAAQKSSKSNDDHPAPERVARSTPAERPTVPGCATAGHWFFCMDQSGEIRRSAAPGEQGVVVAHARRGSPMAAAPIAGSHVVLAFLAVRKTSTGATMLAFASLDDQTPVTISEGGSGATFVALAPRGESVVAMTIDARRVLTPVHARVLGFGPTLALGPDAVLFVGDGTDGRVRGAIAQGVPGRERALLAIDRDEKQFGMAAIHIDEQPQDEAEVMWSMYPAAEPRARVAATQGVLPVRVLRSRPAAAEPQAPLVLELGELDDAGGFKPSCPVAEGPTFADLAMTVDRQGALWLAYTDADGTWIERRGP